MYFVCVGIIYNLINDKVNKLYLNYKHLGSNVLLHIHNTIYNEV